MNCIFRCFFFILYKNRIVKQKKDKKNRWFSLAICLHLRFLLFTRKKRNSHWKSQKLNHLWKWNGKKCAFFVEYDIAFESVVWLYIETIIFSYNRGILIMCSITAPSIKALMRMYLSPSAEFQLPSGLIFSSFFSN